MTPPGQTVCLCMIVKDEAPVIRRCLDSVRPIIDHWIIVDTGSSDGTQDIVRATLSDLPGTLHERPWVDFAANRSESLALARPKGDYSLIIDSDDTLDVPADFRMPDLDADMYTIDIDFGGTRYQRPQIVSNALPWRYEGVIHEFLKCEESKTSGHLPLVLHINQDGARRRDPETYRKDAAVLERALAGETDPFLVARYTFYLAQSYRDCGEKEKAIDAYLRRADLGFWQEEIFVSLYEVGKLMGALGRDKEAVVATFQRATDACPSRAEAAHAASRYLRLAGDFARGYAIAKPALGLAMPAGGLFVEPSVYEYGLLDEFAVNAYWTGRYRDCLDATLRAVSGGKIPPHELSRFYMNMRFALDNLPDPPPDVRPSEPPFAQGSRSIPTTLNLGSGKDFRADALNVDIDASWHPDAVLDLGVVKVGATGISVPTHRFGEALLLPNSFDTIIANDVLEHVTNLVVLMTNCLALLRTDGLFRISVPYDLSFGAWQDPTHVRTFNDRSWLYYTEWFWYLGWREARFVIESSEHRLSPLGLELRDRNVTAEEIARTPRAVDSMSVVLRKIDPTPEDRKALDHWRDRRRHVQDDSERAGSEAGRGTMTAPIAFSGAWEENRDRFCIWIVMPDGYEHHQAFDDVAACLHAAFAALGGSAPIARSRSEWADRVPIVLGAHLLEPSFELPPEALLFNFEQVDAHSAFANPLYLSRLSRHGVLDYSIANTRALKAAGIGHARHFPIRAMPVLARVEMAADPDIDVLFYGSMNERRSEILDALRARDLEVVHLFGVYGQARDETIARAKVVVNIHFYAAAVFEAVRIANLLAKGTCVVSEGRPNDPDSADIADGLVLCPFDEIVERCVELVHDDAKRKTLARRARTTIEARSQAAILGDAFATSG